MEPRGSSIQLIKKAKNQRKDRKELRVQGKANQEKAITTRLRL
jgi:hypothetical protein